MADFKLTPAREKELEKIAKDLPDADFKKRYGNRWMEIKMATAMNILKKKHGFKTEEKMKFKELREKYRSKFPSSLVAAAVKIAIDMGGNMTGAYKKIEAMKKGLANDPMVKDALRQANESVDESTDGSFKLVDMDDKSYKNALMLAKKAKLNPFSKKTSTGMELSVFGDNKSIMKFLKSLPESENNPLEEVSQSAMIRKAIDIASSMAGNYTGAINRIEAIKKGLSKNKNVEKALRLANEERMEIPTNEFNRNI